VSGMRGCNWGCAVALAACLVIDALAAWGAVSLARLVMGG